MNTDKNIAELMDYLYGEMSTIEKEAFEKKLASNPELQAELDEFKETKGLLKNIQEITPSEPLVLTPFVDVHKSKDAIWRRWAGVAASLLVILIAAAWWNLSIEASNGELRISFNKAQQDKLAEEKSLFQENMLIQKNEIDALLKAKISDLQDSLNQQYHALEGQLKAITIKQPTAKNTINEAEIITQEQLALLFNSWNQEQTSNTALLINAANENQKIYTEKLITEFAAYMEAKRESDLELVNYALKEIQTQSNSKQEQTEIILARILEKWENE